MTMIERSADFDEMDRVPVSWLREHAPEQLECECPEACLIDHDN
jgi:hypothetical protein